MFDKIRKPLYWVLTTFFCAMMAMSAYMYLTMNPMAIKGMAQLGYPQYFLLILGPAKLLGVIALMYGRIKTLKEWAYAGFTFNLVAAAASNGMSGGSIGEVITPIVGLVFLFGSYFLGKSLESK